MNLDILNYNNSQTGEHRDICIALSKLIDKNLHEADCKIWHAHPVWFLNDNPTVGYSKQKNGIRLMFWSGKDFNEPALNKLGEKFKDASIFYNLCEEINPDDIKRWLEKAKIIQWDYKNLIKRKGELKRLI